MYWENPTVTRDVIGIHQPKLCHQVLVSMLLLTIYDCKTNKRSDTGDVVKHVRYCEDISWGMGT
ncbi:hypothetical protein YC2023_107258 [Brassica napus]